jgi:hypothetical protein
MEKRGNGRGRAARKRASGFRVSRSRRVGSWRAGAGYFFHHAARCPRRADLWVKVKPTTPVPMWPVVCGPGQAFRCFLNFLVKHHPRMEKYKEIYQ